MKMMRWLPTLTATLALGLLAGCGGSKPESTPAAAGGAAPKGKVKIGFIVKQPEETWFQLEWRFAEDAAKQYGFELLKIAGPDGEKVLTAIDNLAANGAQGFVICTPDVKLGPAIVAKAKAANMKVLAVDDRFIGSDGKPMEPVHYLGISARKIGESVGAALADEMAKRGWKAEDTGCMVITFDELDTIKDRTEGAIAGLTGKGFPADHVYKTATSKLEIPACIDAANVLLTQKAGVKNWLICAGNDTGVMGAVRATEGRGIAAEQVIGIGINGTDCVTEFRKEKMNGFVASSLLSAKEHGFRTAEMMYKWIAEGTEPPLDTRTAGVLINRENYQKVYAEQGINI